MKRFWQAISNNRINFILVILVIFSIFSNFYFFIKEDYLIPPGDDCLRHMTIAYNISQTHTLVSSNVTELAQGLIDIPVFHIWLSVISQITGLDIVITTQYFVRGLMVLIGLTTYFIVKSFFNSRKAGLMAFILLLFYSSTLSVIYAEGTYLDIFAAAFLLPLGLLFFSFYLDKKQKAWRYGILSGIFLVAVAWSHPLTAIGFLIILFIINALSVVFYKRLDIDWRRLIYFDLFILLTLIPAWSYYIRDIAIKIIGLFQFIFIKNLSTAEANVEMNYMPIGFSAPPDYNTYAQYIGIFILFIGLAGLILLIRNNKIDTIIKIIIFSWVLGLFVASRLSLIQLPVRFARDLFLPAIFCAALFFTIYFERMKSFSFLRNIAIIVFALYFSLFLKNLPFGANDYIRENIRLQKPDRLAVEWLKQNTQESDIILGTATMANPWGSFITLLTKQKVLGCDYDGIIEKGDDIKCSSVFNADAPESRKYYKENDIAYVYAGKSFIGGYIWHPITAWSHYSYLERVDYLEKVFDKRDKSGRVVIYKVNKNKL